jgi:signal transduction histidine kinase
MQLANITLNNKSFLSLLLFSLSWITPQYLGAQQPALKNEAMQVEQLLALAQSQQFTDTSSALQACRKALVLAKKNANNMHIYEAIRNQGLIYQNNNQPKTAHTHFSNLLTMIDSVNDRTKCLIYNHVIGSYKSLGDYKNTLVFCLKNQELALKTKNLFIEQQSNLHLGSYYTALNDFEKATRHLMASIDLSNRLNDVDQICESYRLLTIVYLKTKNCDLALKSIEKSFLHVEKISGNIFPKLNVYLSYGNALKDCGKYETALPYLKQGLSLAIKAGDKTHQVNALILLADTYNKMNDLKNAEYHYKACNSLTSFISEGDFVAFHYGYGNLLLKTNNIEPAIIFLKKSIPLAEKHHKKLTLQRVYTHLSDAYERKGNAHESLSYLKKSNIYRDSLYAEENTKNISEAQLKYDAVKSEKEVQNLQQYQLILSVCGLIFILCLLIAFLLNLSYTKNEKNKILADKNEEISAKNRQLEESNEILKQFAFASAHDLKEPLRSINSFVNLIQKRYTDKLPTEATEFMGFVTTGVRRMESLLNALLNFSEVLTDKNFIVQEINGLVILEEVFTMHNDLINEKKAVIQYPSVFPTISMNKTHLQQLLSNIVNNALKYSKNNAKVAINYKITNEEFLISVKDEGIGINESYGDKVFKMFQRLDKKTNNESVGIGLTTCKIIIEKYAGRLWFESVQNEGTTFHIAFPKKMISEIPATTYTPQYLAIKGQDLELSLSL